MKHLSIDIETYSSENLAKCGVYRYCQSPDFQILLFGYSVDGGPVKVVDLAGGENIPDEIICAIVECPFNDLVINDGTDNFIGDILSTGKIHDLYRTAVNGITE